MKPSEAQEGDTLIAREPSLSCIVRGRSYRVYAFHSHDADLETRHGGRLYVCCLVGEHFLDAEPNDSDFRKKVSLKLVDRGRVSTVD